MTPPFDNARSPTTIAPGLLHLVGSLSLVLQLQASLPTERRDLPPGKSHPLRLKSCSDVERVHGTMNVGIACWKLPLRRLTLKRVIIPMLHSLGISAKPSPPTGVILSPG
ncbi:hypothetical protein B0H63DRAFT_486460 [Podospora didyma]|uniref:Uncharacterized protein n=1 Tax=Podospora didyma TaxID=330526 RepID=A0AAE0K5U8_9PEZI|nr:hypothetical protein B0H63DRAFT_486460 [Podospora didyma]